MTFILSSFSGLSRGYFIFFFFQAEDGIRDFHVTGVQTCALPISSRSAYPNASDQTSLPSTATARAKPGMLRSEERRVGKECRSGWSPEHSKKKKICEQLKCVGYQKFTGMTFNGIHDS